MSEIIDRAVAELNEKMGAGFDGSAKFVIAGEGSIVVDEAGARAADTDEAEVTLTADADTFRDIFEGELDPTAAFMSGRLTIEGDMGQAMKLAQTLG